MKIVEDFVKPTASGKFDTDVREFIDAFNSDPDVIGAITVNVLGAEDDEDAARIIATETRAFQAATLKLGYSARRQDVRDNGDGTHDVLFSIGLKAVRKQSATVETAPESDASEKVAKSGK